MLQIFRDNSESWLVCLNLVQCQQFCCVVHCNVTFISCHSGSNTQMQFTNRQKTNVLFMGNWCLIRVQALCRQMVFLGLQRVAGKVDGLVKNASFVFSFSLSHSLLGGHRPNPLQELPEASWIHVEYSSQPDVSSGLVMSWTPEHKLPLQRHVHVFHRRFCRNISSFYLAS